MANRRVKYSPSAVEALLRAYENGANDEEAAKTVGITRPTIYSWCRTYEGLKERVAAARDAYEQKQAESIISELEQCRQLAESYVIRLLKGEIKKTKPRTDGSGNITWIEEEQVMPTERIIERFLPQGNSEDTQFVINFGSAIPPTREEKDDE